MENGSIRARVSSTQSGLEYCETTSLKTKQTSGVVVVRLSLRIFQKQNKSLFRCVCLSLVIDHVRYAFIVF